MALLAGGGSAWALDRFVTDHVQISDVAAYEATRASGSAASTLSSGGTVSGSSYSSDGADVELSTVVTGTGNSTVTALTGASTATDRWEGTVVWSFSSEEQDWVLQPLIDAGLGPDEICTLLFRLAFEAIVGKEGGGVADISGPVADRPWPVRAAWSHSLGRMLVVQDPNDDLAS
jgi:hypothetical protein